MKPKIGRKIYCIYGDGIFIDTVGYIGKDSFIINGFGCATEENSWEWFYEDYDKKWFTSLSKAKKALIEKYQDRYADKLKVVQVIDDWYELEFC